MRDRRKVLRQVVNGVHAAQALKSIGMDSAERDAKTFWFKTRKEFVDQLEFFASELRRNAELLKKR